MNRRGSDALEFGDLRLEPDESLWRGPSRVPLPPKEAALLRLLAEARGRVISKDEIFDRIWPGEPVGEASITRCVRGLRVALGEGGRRGGTIETLHGRGYRLASAVRSLAPPLPERPDESIRLAVSPFEPAGDPPEDAYLGSGIAGEVTDALAQRCAPGVTVIARQSAGRLVRAAPDLQRVARKLRLDYLLTGWLRFEAAELRVQAELVRVRDQTLVWSQEFRERSSSIARLPARIALAVAREVGGAGARASATRSARGAPRHPKAYLALLQGQFACQLRTERGIRRGMKLFEQAIAWDPDHAEAHAALADAHLMLAFRGYEAPLDVAPRVRILVRKALALDRSVASTFALLAYLRWAIDRDPAGALRAAERARSLEPGHARTEWIRGQILLSLARFDDALAACESSIDADPFSPSAALAVGLTQLCAGRVEEARESARSLTARDPDFALGHALAATIAAWTGRRQEAVHAARIAEELARGDQVTLGSCAWAFAQAGQTSHASAIRSALERRAARRYVGPSHLAVAALGFGDTEAALGWLERGLEQRCMYLPHVAVDPRFAPLRGEARFRRIIAIALGGAGKPASRARTERNFSNDGTHVPPKRAPRCIHFGAPSQVPFVPGVFVSIEAHGPHARRRGSCTWRRAGRDA